MADCTLYIDEAGDLGIGRGSDWFVLAGVLINKSDELEIRETLKTIKSKTNINEVHLRKMQSFDKKAYAVGELSKCNFEYITIIVNTNQLNITNLYEEYTEKPCILSYNHVCRYLLERASWLLRDTNRSADIMLSSRGTSRDGGLIAYIKDKLIPFEGNKINNCFEKVIAKPASSWDMLQLADVCASSMFNMHQVNALGHTTPCYTYRLYSHLYRYNGKLMRYGIKYYDDSMIPGKDYLVNNSFCRR